VEKRALSIQSGRLYVGSTHSNSNLLAINDMFSHTLMNARRLGKGLVFVKAILGSSLMSWSVP